MKTIFLIHGTDGSGNRGWFPEIKKELEKKGYIVIAPDFPSIENESYKSWFEILSPYLHQIDASTVFVGHSLGVAFILKLLSEETIDIHSAYFIGGFCEQFSDEVLHQHYEIFTQKYSFNKPMETLYNYESFVENLDFGTIKRHCEKFYVFASVDDPYIPLEMSHTLKNVLNTEYFEYPNEKHFGKKDAPDFYLELLEIILQ